MTSRTLAKFALVCALALPVFASAQIAPATGHSFRVEGDHFALDGKPFQVLAGEMHYARIPRAYWRDRLRMAKAMGLNTVTTYVFWNAHEPQPASTISPAITTSPSSSAKRSRKASTSFSAPAPTSAPNGNSAASRPGFSKITP